MPAEDGAPETREEWEIAIKSVASQLCEASHAGAVIVVIAQADWMEKDSDFIGGVAGSASRCNPARLAQHLRDMARIVEGQAANIAAGVPFEVEEKQTESAS